ncbi:tetratricopeptide repeat protein [Aggregatilinea lenta]|uniref:tetratricopeptide repeat protein n=1 Tax=Aggregatilinea lenta TaxID=913108 RepID=UPI000E5A9B62|nr:tetratricopeptide repeat protein [Aggregatilinea lenta]
MAENATNSTSDQPQKPPMNEEAFRRMMRQAAFLLTHGSSREAIPLLEECLEFHPDDVDVLTNLAGAYILAERHRHAVPLMERASELAPENPAVWSNLGAAYLGKLITANAERRARALAAYARVIELDPSYPNVHYNVGLIHIDRREWNEAFAAFTRALETNPNDEDAHNMRRRVDELRNQPTDHSASD